MGAANKEQNQMYPPSIFNIHINLTTKFLIDELVKVYSTNQYIKDALDPFLEKVSVNVVNGVVKFPEKYRHFMGLSAFIKNESGRKSPCDCGDDKDASMVTDDCASPFDGDPMAKTPAQKKADQLKRGCQSQLIEIVDIDEWDERTKHPYDSPSLDNPIGCMFGNGEIRICPFNISSVEIRYVREPKMYSYGYKMMPDDTYQFDPASTIESEWTSNAEQYIYKAMGKLYAQYTRDGLLADSLRDLSTAGIF